jgi:peptide/nickel transport system ATP-binding protein
MNESALFEIRDLTVDYGRGPGAVRAVDKVNLTLKRGETLGLAGESGCGKSTLAAAVTRLLRPPGRVVSGEISYKGTDVLKMSADDLRAWRWNEVAIVFQSAMNALNPVLDVQTQLSDTIAAHRPEGTKKERRDRAAELLTTVGVPVDRLRSYPHELSGGMRQRVMIAMALALDPEVLVLDEPTTALDVIVQREILVELARLREEFGFAVLFITHDLSLLLELADNIAVMYAGRIAEYGPAEKIYREPAHPYTRGLLNSFPPLRGPRRELEGIIGSPPDLTSLPPGCSFAPRCPKAFEPCHVELPLHIAPIDTVPTDNSNAVLVDLPGDRFVACHLHDPRFAATSVAAAEAAEAVEPAETTASAATNEEVAL